VKKKQLIITGLLLSVLIINLGIITSAIEDILGVNSLKGLMNPIIEEKGQSFNNTSLDFNDRISNHSFESSKNSIVTPSVSKWADDRFKYRKNIIIPFTKITKDFTNFPVLIDLFDPDLKNVLQSSGNDILFTDASGTQLDHEIEVFNQTYNSTHVHLVAWVRGNLSSTKDTIFSMYYGNTSVSNQENPEAVWKQDFTAVWHLSETSGPRYDSTQNNFDGSPQNFDKDEAVNGIIDGADEFDGINDYIETYKSAEDLEIIGNWPKTVSAWVYTKNFSDGGIFEFGQLATRKYFSLRTLSNPNEWRGDWWGDYDDFKYTSLDTWVYFVVTYDGKNVTIFANSEIMIDTPKTLIIENKVTFKIGSWNNNYYNGSIDEMRVSSVIRSDDWIKTEYLNQHDPDNFYSISKQEFDENSPVVNDFGVVDKGDGKPTFCANVTDDLTSVTSVSIKINSSIFDMKQNMSGIWVYQYSSINYGDYFTFQINNASDSMNNYMLTPSSEKTIIFDKDIVKPDVLQWEYLFESNTFKANVTDFWGEIDTVYVNVTTYNLQAIMVSYATIASNTFAYVNDTLVLDNGPMVFQIIINDTCGNEYTSPLTKGLVFINNPPIAENVTLTPLPLLSSSSLKLNYDYYDKDNHAEEGTEIRWYKNNGSGFILQKNYNDITKIPSSALERNNQWYVTIRPKDGKIFGDLVNTSETIGFITVLNTPPQVTVIDENHPEFIIEDHDLILDDSYYILTDSDGDNVQLFIWWYKDGELQSKYTNQRIIPSSVILAGDQWYYVIQPNDNFDNGTDQESPVIVVESKPEINDYNVIAVNDTEGHYSIEINVTDSRNEIKYVQFHIFCNATNYQATKIVTTPKAGTSDIWLLDYQLNNLSWLNSVIEVEIEVISELKTYSKIYTITSTFTFDFLLEDTTPPRVIESYYTPDDDIRPTTLIFYTEIEEYGFGIDEINLYYYFEESQESYELAGYGASLIQGNEAQWLHVRMEFYNKSANNYIYAAMIPFPQNKGTWKLIYRISTSDMNGNINENAFTIDPQQAGKDVIIVYSPLGSGLDLFLVLLSIFLIIICASIFSIVYSKLFRKPELIGLDKKLVLKHIDEIDNVELRISIPNHTLGIVVSLFDEEKGPIPQIVTPRSLRNDPNMLLSLSFRAFSNCEFTVDPNRINQAIFNFTTAQNTLIKVLSYSFALKRPSARGGTENIVLSILILPDVFPIVNQFSDMFFDRIKRIHKLLDQKPEEKKQIFFKIIELQEYISQIILSYMKISGNTEYFPQ